MLPLFTTKTKITAIFILVAIGIITFQHWRLQSAKNSLIEQRIIASSYEKALSARIQQDAVINEELVKWRSKGVEIKTVYVTQIKRVKEIGEVYIYKDGACELSPDAFRLLQQTADYTNSLANTK